MNPRLFKIANFFAFNLLFFALYLNFIHKDSNSQTPPIKSAVVSTMKGTVLVTNPDQYLGKTRSEAITAGLQN